MWFFTWAIYKLVVLCFYNWLFVISQVIISPLNLSFFCLLLILNFLLFFLQQTIHSIFATLAVTSIFFTFSTFSITATIHFETFNIFADTSDISAYNCTVHSLIFNFNANWTAKARQTHFLRKKKANTVLFIALIIAAAFVHNSLWVAFWFLLLIYVILLFWIIIKMVPEILSPLEILEDLLKLEDLILSPRIFSYRSEFLLFSYKSIALEMKYINTQQDWFYFKAKASCFWSEIGQWTDLSCISDEKNLCFKSFRSCFLITFIIKRKW